MLFVPAFEGEVFIGDFHQGLDLRKAQPPSNRPPKSLVILTFVYTNSIAAYGSPVQANNGVLGNGKLSRYFRREESSDGRVCYSVSFG